MIYLFIILVSMTVFMAWVLIIELLPEAVLDRISDKAFKLSASFAIFVLIHLYWSSPSPDQMTKIVTVVVVGGLLLVVNLVVLFVKKRRESKIRS